MFKILLIVILCSKISSIAFKRVDCFPKFCRIFVDYTKSEQSILCKDFSNFSNLKFNCSNNSYFQNFVLVSYKKIIFDQNIELNYSTFSMNISRFVVTLTNIEKISLKSSLFSNYLNAIKISNCFSVLLFTKSNFVFYKSLDDSKNKEFCTVKYFKDVLKQQFPFNNFSDFNIKNNVKFPTELCPLVFKGIDVYGMYFNGLEFSFIKKNVLTFSKIDLQNETSMHKIADVIFNIYRVKISEQNALNWFVFGSSRNLNSLAFIGVIEDFLWDHSIDSFLHLKNVYFWLQNLKHFFSMNKNWIIFLNSYTFKYEKILYVEIKENLILYTGESAKLTYNYKYPNEDFCLFKDFPQEKKIATLLYDIEHQVSFFETISYNLYVSIFVHSFFILLFKIQ